LRGPARTSEPEGGPKQSCGSGNLRLPIKTVKAQLHPVLGFVRQPHATVGQSICDLQMQYLKVDPHSCGASGYRSSATFEFAANVPLKLGSGYLRSGPLQSEDASMKISVPLRRVSKGCVSMAFQDSQSRSEPYLTYCSARNLVETVQYTLRPVMSEVAGSSPVSSAIYFNNRAP
jgi:hypothetical protein